MPQFRIIFTMSSQGYPSAAYSDSNSDTDEIVTPSAGSSDSDSATEEIVTLMTPQDLDTLARCYGIHLCEAGWDSDDEDKTAFEFNLEPCPDESVLISWNDDKCERCAVDLQHLTLQDCTEMTYSHWLSSLMPPNFNKKNIVLSINEELLKTSRFELPKPSGDNSVELSTWEFRADWLFFYSDIALDTAFNTWDNRYGTLAGHHRAERGAHV